jgi:hypothetical protein
MDRLEDYANDHFNVEILQNWTSSLASKAFLNQAVR